MKKITLLFILLMTMPTWSNGQCTSIAGGYYGGVVMANDGTAELISNDNWPAGEYSSVENLIIGNTYTVTATNTGGMYITIAEIDWLAPALGGTVLGHGPASVSFTATTTDVIIHWHLNALCDDSGNEDTVTTIQCTSASCTCTASSVPDSAVATAPANGAIGVPIDFSGTTPTIAGFAWTDNGEATSYDFNIIGVGTAPGVPNPVDINYNWEYNTTYSWSITSTNCLGTVTSTEFTFTTASDPLSIDDQVLDSFSIYPNPVNDYLNIDTSLTIESIVLTDLLGKQVLTINGNSITNNRIDLSSQSNGLYIMKINALEKSQTFKIIKE